ncbi:MAG: T9SS type A sorting domain-containing protein [bacterium]
MRGTLTVEARDGTISVTAHLSITLFAGTPTTVWILDKQGVFVTRGTITAGGSLFFLGSGTDKYGNSADSFQYFWQTTAGIINPILGTSTTLTGTRATTGTLTLTANGTQTSISVTILPTSTTKFIFEHIPSPQRPGTPFDVTLNSADEFDNLTQDSHIAGTVTLTISNGTSSLGTMSVISGFGTKSICIDSPGSYTIYARGTFTQSPEIVLQGTSNSFLVETGTPTQFIFLLPPGTISVSAAGTTTITAYLADNTGFRVGTAGVECNLSIWAKTPNATGTLGTLTTITDVNGQISTTCQVGTTAGSQIKVLITTNSFNGIAGTSSLIITKNGSVAKFEFSDIGTQTAGIPFWGTITANDDYGNLAEDFIGTVSLGVLALPSGTITPTQTGIFTNGQWTGTMTITTAFMMGSIIAMHSSGAAGTSNLFTVIPAGLHHINLIPTYATTTIEGTISFSCNGEDAYGNKIDGLIYDWESMVGTFTPAQGTSTVFTAGTLATTGTIAVKSGTRTAIGTVTILAGTLSSLAISPSPATMTAGSTLTLTAIGYDAYWNELATISCTWETNIGTITYQLPGTTAYLYATKTGAVTVTATSNNIATSTTITINPAALHHFEFTTISDTVAGEEFIFDVDPKDRFDNATSDVDIVLGTLYKGGNLSWDGTFSTTNSFKGSFTLVGTYNVLAKKLDNESIRGTSNTFSITAATDTARFDIILGTNSVSVGATTSVTVQLTDQYGNPVEIQGTTAELSVIGTGTLDRTVGTTNTEGKIEAIWTASTEVGTESFIQVVSVYGTSTSATITTKIGTLSYITLSTQTINLQVDATCTITATGYDEFGHKIIGLIFDWATTLGTLTSIIGSTTTFEAGTLAGKGTLTVKYDNVATQTSININPGTITHFSFEPIANQIRDEIFYATVTARDKYENLIPDYATETNLYDATNGTLTTINLNQGIGAGSISLGTEFLGMTYILSQANDIRGTSNDFFVLIDDAQGGTVTKIFAQGTTTIAFKNGVFQGIDYYPDINPATSSVMIDTANSNLDPSLEEVPSSIREIKVFSGTPTLLHQTFETDTVTLSLSYVEHPTYSGYVATGNQVVFEESLKIYRLKEDTSQWVLIPGTVNTELNIVTASIPHLPATYILIGNIPTLDHFAFSTHPPAIACAGEGFSIGIEARDKNGNRLGNGMSPFPPYNGTASLGLNIPGTITPEVIPFTNGYFTDNASITTAGANISIIVESDGKIGTSGLFTVWPQLYTHFEFDYIGTMNVGIPGTITIFAKDEFGNNDDLNHSTITVSLEVQGNVIIPSQVTIPDGTGTWCGTVTIYNNQINARIIAKDGSSVGTSNPFNIIGGELASIIIEPATPTIAQFGTASFMAKGYTSSHFEILPDAGYTWTVSNNLLGSFTFMSEKGTFTIFQAGTKAMTGTIAVTSGSITAIATITVNPGSVTSLLISPHGATTTSNSEVKYEVTAVDSYGNTWTVTAQTQFVTNDPAGTMTDGKEIYTAGKVGTWTIAGTHTSGVGTSTYVVVSVGTPTALTIIPEGTTVKAGDMVSYTAIAEDTKGNTWTVTAQTLFATNDPAGTMTANVYTAGKVGTWTIAGTHTSGVGTSTYVVVSVGTPTALTIIPEGTTVKAGDMVSYTAIAEDTKGNTWTVTAQTQFATNDPAGTITANVYTAGKVGTWTIAGTHTSGVGTSTYVMVSVGTPTALTIIPEGRTVKAGDMVSYTAIAEDTKGNTWTVTAQTQFATNDPAGTITANLYTAGNVGTWTIAGTHTSGVGTSTYVVVSVGTPTTLTIIPEGTTVKAGDMVSYTAIAEDTKGNTWTVTAQTQFATNDPIGTITDYGTYTAGKSGIWQIYGTYTKNSTKVATTTTVNVIVGTATALNIIPASLTLKSGEQISYQAIARDTKGNTWTVTSLTQFATDDPIGTITEHGTYTAGKVGRWMISGTYTIDAVGATATVYVEHGSATSLFINPATSVVGAAGTISYTTIAQDLHSNTWTVTAQTQFATDDPAGTMTANIYTAGQMGTHTIYATYTLIGTTATVYVTVGELDHFNLDSILQWFKNEPGTMTISTRDKKDNLVPTSTTFTLTPQNIITPYQGTMTDGVATMNLIISKAGPVIITAYKDNIQGTITLMILLHKELIGTETLMTPDNLVTEIRIPADTIATDYYVVIGTPTAQTNPDIANANNKLSSAYKYTNIREFNIKNAARGTITQVGTITITIPYEDTTPDEEYVDINGINVKEKTLWIYGLQNSEWKKIDNQLPDRTNNWVRAEAGSFSIFVLIGETTAPDLTKLLVYPNPVRVNKGDTEVIFENLSNNAVIRIYTISGELVWIKEKVAGMTKWDLKNDYNQPVASGVYIYIIHDENEIIRGKIAVIR